MNSIYLLPSWVNNEKQTAAKLFLTMGIILGVNTVCTWKMVYIKDIYFFEVNTKSIYPVC